MLLDLESFCDLVAGIQVKYNGYPIINFTDLINLDIHFKILSTFSNDDVNVISDSINFSKNNANSFSNSFGKVFKRFQRFLKLVLKLNINC